MWLRLSLFAVVSKEVSSIVFYTSIVSKFKILVSWQSYNGHKNNSSGNIILNIHIDKIKTIFNLIICLLGWEAIGWRALSFNSFQRASRWVNHGLIVGACSVT